MMRNRRLWYVLAGALMLVCLSAGCSGTALKNKLVSKLEGESEASPTPAVSEAPEATPTPTPVPATPSPVPTSTPAPRRIGTKTPHSSYIYFTNGLSEALREVYMKGQGESDWGKNMVPVEATVKAGEKVQFCYTPLTGSDGLYDIKVVDKKGNSYAVYQVNLSDMEEGTIRIEDSSAYITYISLATGDEARAENSETLAQNYDTSGQQSGSSHEGDYNYGYYDDYGNWVAYTASDYNNYSSSGSSSSGSTVGNPNYGYYDDYGNWVPYDYDQSSSGGSTVGDPNYGYYDDYGNWISYY